MARKCPPGVFCIDNVTLFFLVFVLFISLYFLFRDSNVSSKKQNAVHLHMNNNDSFPATQQRHPIASLAPPLISTSGLQIHNNPPRRQVGIPINISTSHLDTAYQQVGILTRQSNQAPTPTESGMILALFGRPLHTNRNKWQYYTMTDRSNTIRLPVSKGGRSCSGNFGCDEIVNGDNVYVEGYNDVFAATIYDNELPRYIPFI